MTISRFKFPRRVRIHGGECGAVARALHHEAQKVALTQNEQTLISDEKAFMRQADPKKSFGSTSHERKQMSTKTTLKRIALVAVSALGFGLMSIVPARAAAPNTATISLGSTVTTCQAGALCEVTVSLVHAAFAASDVLNLTVASTTKPNGATANVTDEDAGTATTYDEAGEFGLTKTGEAIASEADANITDTYTNGAIIYTADGDGGADAVTTASQVGTLAFLSVHPGQYTFTISADSDTADTEVATFIVLPSTSSDVAISATQSASLGKSDVTNTITLARATGGANTDGQILGQFTTTADATDAPLTTVFGKVAGTTDLGAVTVGGTAAAPTFAVARTNLAAGSYTVRFWTDENSNGIYDSASESTVSVTFSVAGAADSIALAVTGSTRANETGHKQVTVVATVTDADGNGSTSSLYISESSSAGADSANSYFDFADDTVLTRIGVTNTYTITFNVDTGTGGDDYDTAYFTVHSDTDIDAAAALETTSSVKIVNFANLEDTDAAMTATDSTGIGSYAATGVRQELYATDDADDTLTVDPAITSITYTGAAEDDAGEFIYWSAVPTAGTTTCLTSSSGYVEVLGDQSFTVTIAATCTDAEGYTITFTGSDNAALTITYDDPSPTWTTTPGASWKAVNGSTNTLTARLTDQYGRVLANKAVTSVVTGRNPATTTHTTSAAGYVTWTGTDSSTSTVVLTDSIVFNYPYTSSAGTAATASSTARVITYAATAVAVGSITLTDDEADNSVAIDQKESTPGVPADYVVYTATLKTAAGAPVTSGVLVTFTGGADDLFYGGSTGVTNAAGQATVNVYRHKVGYSTITASANGVSSAANNVVDWVNVDADRRYVSVSAAQSVVAGGVATVTATVTDRWGNPIETGVNVTFIISGNGRLVTGDNGGTKETNTVGTAQIQVTSNSNELGTMNVAAVITGGQSADLAGYVDGTAVAGVSKAVDTASSTVTFTKDTSVSTADALLELAKAIGTGKEVTAAADAAAEAIDAANAATDAANLAAEAADAATVAAEEARDAADAATAAVEELGTQVATLMSALKAQLTTLANTVAKIAKKVKA